MPRRTPPPELARLNSASRRDRKRGRFGHHPLYLRPVHPAGRSCGADLHRAPVRTGRCDAGLRPRRRAGRYAGIRHAAQDGRGLRSNPLSTATARTKTMWIAAKARVWAFSRQRPAKENVSRYLVPQECGNRTGVRWAEVTDHRGRGLRFTSGAHGVLRAAVHAARAGKRHARLRAPADPLHGHPREPAADGRRRATIAGARRTHEEYLLDTSKHMSVHVQLQGHLISFRRSLQNVKSLRAQAI